MRSDHPIVRLLIILGLLIGLSSCGGKANVTSNAPDDPKTRWLKGQPCAPPCWENVQPGSTQPEKAITLLKASSLVVPASIQVEKHADIGAGLITWTFKSSATAWTGKIGYRSDLNVVQAITLMTPDLCLGEIVDAYGQPDYLFLPAYEAVGTVDLIWKSSGFMFEVQGGSPDKPITDNTCNGGVVQFAAGTPFQQIPSPYFMFATDDNFVPWTGYGHYGK